MIYGVNSAQQVSEELAVADITLVEIDLRRRYAGGWPVRVHWCGERVEDDDVVTEREEPVQVCDPMNPAPPVTSIFTALAPPVIRDLAVYVEGRCACRPPGKLSRTLEPEVTQAVTTRARGLDDRPGDRRRLLRIQPGPQHRPRSPASRSYPT